MEGIPDFIEKRKPLMEMIMKGRIEDAFDIFGNKVKFRTLDSDESTDALKATSGFDSLTKTALLQKELLSRALVSVNDDFVPSVTEARVFLGKLSPVLLDEFWRNYDELKTRRDLLIEQAMVDLKKSSRNQSPANTGGSADSQNPSGSAPSIL